MSLANHWRAATIAVAAALLLVVGTASAQAPNGAAVNAAAGKARPERKHTDPSRFKLQIHSLQKPYFVKGMAIPYWDFVGNSVVSDDYIRLTPDRQSKRGGLWNHRPMTANDWEVTVQFKVHGQGSTLYGDGFAFWYTKERNTLGRVFGSRDKFTGLGVFFDTYDNGNSNRGTGAYISAMVNDGTIEYDHDQDGTQQEIASCHGKFRNLEHDTFFRILYRKRSLKLLVDFENTGEWSTCFFVGDIFLPRGYYLGLSAATGDLADNHDVISVASGIPPALTPEETQTLEDLAKKDKEEGLNLPDDPEKDIQKPFAPHHKPHRDGMKEHRKITTFNAAHLKGKVLHQAGDVDSSDGAFTSSWLMYSILGLVVLAGIGGIVYKTQVLDKKSKQRFDF